MLTQEITLSMEVTATLLTLIYLAKLVFASTKAQPETPLLRSSHLLMKRSLMNQRITGRGE